jgi:hypothetical protein
MQETNEFFIKDLIFIPISDKLTAFQLINAGLNVKRVG